MNQCHRRVRTGLVACALMLAAGTARAQDVDDDAIMPPRDVAWRLADRGFTGIGRPHFDGRAYVVEAFGPGGARLRLFVDAQDGTILGRRLLDAPPAALARSAAPGYGWTEEDDRPRRPLRQAERLIPPADIPMPESRGVPVRRSYGPEGGPVRSDGSVGAPGRAAIDPNPQGINPDPRGRADAPKRVARIGNPVKSSDGKVLDGKTLDGKTLDGKTLDGKAQTRAVPDAPKLRPVEETAEETVKPELPVAAVAPSRAAPPSVPPAAVQPPSQGRVAQPVEAPPAESGETKSGETKSVETTPAEPTWKDPPEAKRTVRVIGGATLVPGAADREPAAP